jgi:hypothetical protein
LISAGQFAATENGFKMLDVGQTINLVVQHIKFSGPTSKYGIDFNQ